MPKKSKPNCSYDDVLKAEKSTNSQIDEKKEIIRKAVINASKRLDLNQKDLSLILGFSESKASHLFNYNAYIEPNSKEWDLAVLFLRMYRNLDSLFGNDSQSRLWINSQNKSLQGIPRELIKKVEGLVEVIQYLDAYRGLA